MRMAPRTTWPKAQAPVRRRVAKNKPSTAVECPPDGESQAVSPANNATLPMGSMVVHRVAKSLLILIKRGDMNVNLALALQHRRIKREAKERLVFELLGRSVSYSRERQGTSSSSNQSASG